MQTRRSWQRDHVAHEALAGHEAVWVAGRDTTRMTSIQAANWIALHGGNGADIAANRLLRKSMTEADYKNAPPETLSWYHDTMQTAGMLHKKHTIKGGSFWDLLGGMLFYDMLNGHDHDNH